jgi:hypothetical protein
MAEIRFNTDFKKHVEGLAKTVDASTIAENLILGVAGAALAGALLPQIVGAIGTGVVAKVISGLVARGVVGAGAARIKGEDVGEGFREGINPLTPIEKVFNFFNEIFNPESTQQVAPEPEQGIIPAEVAPEPEQGIIPAEDPPEDPGPPKMVQWQTPDGGIFTAKQDATWLPPGTVRLPAGQAAGDPVNLLAPPRGNPPIKLVPGTGLFMGPHSMSDSELPGHTVEAPAPPVITDLTRGTGLSPAVPGNLGFGEVEQEDLAPPPQPQERDYDNPLTVHHQESSLEMLQREASEYEAEQRAIAQQERAVARNAAIAEKEQRLRSQNQADFYE